MRHVVVIAICSMVLISGCATWNGTLNPRDPIKPLEGVPQIGKVWFEKPIIVDNDKQHDFTPIAETYASSLQAQMAGNACSSKAFRSCLTSPPKDGDAYKVSTKINIRNYRIAKGGEGLLFVSGLLLPPIIGLAWSIPVAFGNIDFVVHWDLQNPKGETIAEGVGSYNRSSNVFFKYAEDFLPNFTGFLKTASAAIADLEPKPVEFSKPFETIPTKQELFVPAVNQAPVVRNTTGPGPIVAVFDLEDESGQIKRNTLNQLTSYLVSKLTQVAGYRVVPRDQLRLRLVQEQNNSYKECYDQSCQIELGKAMAAEKSLATQIIRIGNKCAVTSSLFDLRTETTEQAASADTGCSDEDLMEAMKQIADQLRIR